MEPDDLENDDSRTVTSLSRDHRSVRRAARGRAQKRSRVLDRFAAPQIDALGLVVLRLEATGCVAAFVGLRLPWFRIAATA